MTATRTRRKLQAEMVRSALEAEEKKRRQERENFLLTTVPVTIQAAYEPALHHVSADDHEEGMILHCANKNNEALCRWLLLSHGMVFY